MKYLAALLALLLPIMFLAQFTSPLDKYGIPYRGISMHPYWAYPAVHVSHYPAYPAVSFAPYGHVEPYSHRTVTY